MESWKLYTRRFTSGGHRPFAERAQKMRQAAAVLRAGKEKYARTMALEMGKPIVQGEAEAEKCAWTCDYRESGRSCL
jgi:acyl-CoA reductase-like NAD-dependent aldehyde dehydrogenase